MRRTIIIAAVTTAFLSLAGCHDPASQMVSSKGLTSTLRR